MVREWGFGESTKQREEEGEYLKNLTERFVSDLTEQKREKEVLPEEGREDALDRVV